MFVFWQVKGKEVKRDEKFDVSLSEDGLTYTLKIKDVKVSDTGDYTVSIGDLAATVPLFIERTEEYFMLFALVKKLFLCVLVCCSALLCLFFFFPKRAVSPCFSGASISRETNFPPQTRLEMSSTASFFNFLHSPEIRGFRSFVAMLNNIISPSIVQRRRMGSVINPPFLVLS